MFPVISTELPSTQTVTAASTTLTCIGSGEDNDDFTFEWYIGKILQSRLKLAILYHGYSYTIGIKV